MFIYTKQPPTRINNQNQYTNYNYFTAIFRDILKALLFALYQLLNIFNFVSKIILCVLVCPAVSFEKLIKNVCISYYKNFHTHCLSVMFSFLIFVKNGYDMVFHIFNIKVIFKQRVTVFPYPLSLIL